MSLRSLLSLPVAVLLTTTAALAQTPTLGRADYASFAGARAIATADFNRDGWPDVAHANAGRDSVTVVLNRERTAAGFVREFDVPVGHGPFDIAVGDFNRDRIPDLAVANADANTISVLLGDGTGRFARSDVAAPGNPRGIAVIDVNRDGKPDIVYTGFGINRIQFLVGDGAGHFSIGSSINGIAQRPQGVAAADFNNDGHPDLAVAYASPGGRLAIIYTTTADSSTFTIIPGEDNLNVVTTGDFNRDGWQDVAAASTGNSRMAVYLGSATGLHQAATYATGTSPRGIKAVDLNQDGRLDLITANRESNTVTLFTARADAPGAFTSMEFAAGRGSRDVVAADFNNDALIDAATGNQDDASVTALWNGTRLVRPGLSFRVQRDGTDEESFGSDLVVVDIDHDGRLDRVTSGGYIFFGDGRRSTFTGATGLPQVADLNRDGNLDMAFLDSFQGRNVRILFGDGHGGFGAPTTAGSFRDNLGDMHIGDMNRDGIPDLVISSIPIFEKVGAVYFLAGKGDGTFAAPTQTAIKEGPSFSIADLDQDGKLDVLAVPYQDFGKELIVLFGDGQGGFARTVTYPTPDRLADVHVADLNHDGAMDVVGGTFLSVLVMLGDETGRLGPPRSFPSSSYFLDVADMNNDGTLDLVTNGFGIEIWYGVGDGTFGPPQGFRGFGGRPHAIDVNSDGVVDIISDASRGVMYGERRETNRPPVANAGPDVTVSYTNLFLDEEDERTVYLTGILSSDPDQHRLDSEWRAPDGTVISNHDTVRAPQWAPGRYDLTLRVFDGRGGTSDDHMILTITGIPEIVLHTVRDGAAEHGAWSDVQDSTGASGFRKFNPDRGAAKVTMPAADPADYFEVWFTADPTQEYKLWIRGKAQNNSWSNDSAFVQFDSTVDASGAPAYRIGTTSALTFNLEECSGCGVAGWGWEDDGWGAVNQNGVTLRFAEGGPQRIRIQKREDGLSIDQIVLSAQRFKTTRPGKAKNDTTILPEAR